MNRWRDNSAEPWDGDLGYVPDGLFQYWREECIGNDDPVEAAALGYPAMWAKIVRDRDAEEDDLSRYDYVGTAWKAGANSHLNHDEWRQLFNEAGYRINDEPAERPTDPVVLWRGGMPQFRDMWSWTPDRSTALIYASGQAWQPEVGIVWRAAVEPWRLFARVYVGEFHMYVVDTDDLLIEPHGLWCECPTTPADLEAFRGDDEAAQIALDLHELVLCPRP